MGEQDKRDGGMDGRTRRAQPLPEDLALSAQAEEWLKSLPAEVYPHETVARFPRIVNAIASRRRRVRDLRSYFDSLLNDDRGGRQGFPFKVMMELQALRDHMQAGSADKGPHWY